MNNKVKHFLYVPFVGLGLYGGFRGNRWLKNRIKIFKQFVVPSLRAQTSQNFTIWISWLPEQRHEALVQDLKAELEKEFDVVFTYNGVCFYDDKYQEPEATEKLLTSLHFSMGELINNIGQVEEVLMTIQPSDDLYAKDTVKRLQKKFNEDRNIQALGFENGYICNYLTKEVKDYNPKTNPPFYTIRFPKEVFLDPRKHSEYTSIKRDVGKYKKGTPIPSHEYVGDALKLSYLGGRGFLVGCHGENISTHFNNPFGGDDIEATRYVLADFGISAAPPLQINISLRKILMRKLPYQWQRKLRYWFGERFYQHFYKWIRN